MQYVVVIVLVLLMLIFFPFGLIWAINTLFGLSIPFTGTTWLAALVLSSPFIGRSK